MHRRDEALRRLAAWTVCALLVGAAAACGGGGSKSAGDGGVGSADAAPGPCDLPNPPPECSLTCQIDPDCVAGYHCDTDQGTCTADCTQGGDECGPHAMCDIKGHCVSTDAQCGYQLSVAPDQSPLVMLVIDHSGSMSQEMAGMTRWDAVEYALTDSGQAALLQYGSVVAVGATLFNGPQGTCPRLISAPVALDNATNIRTLLHSSAPSGSTPTPEAIANVSGQFQTDGTRPRVEVLVADDDPNTCIDSSKTPQAEAEAEQVIAQAHQDGITTYVVGVGADAPTGNLTRLANLGQGMPPDTGTAAPFIGTTPDELAAAFNQVFNRLVVFSCDIPLQGTVDPDLVDQGTVMLNGNELTYGTDWTVTDGMTLELLGSACTEFQQGGGSPSLSIMLSCTTAP